MKCFYNLITPASLSRFTFYCLLASGFYIILLWSPNVMGSYFSRWTKVIIYIFPWLTLWLVYSWRVVTNKEHRLKIILIFCILIFGVTNTYFSTYAAKSLFPMLTFLLTGIFALWTSMLLLTDHRRRQIFDWFCAGALAVIILVEIIVYLVRGSYGSGTFQTFAAHPIPLGTVILLLSPGPVRLILGQYFPTKLLGCLLGLSGFILIFLTHKRGTWLALAGMLVGGIIYLVRRHRSLILVVLLTAALLLSLGVRHKVARLDPKIPHDVSILHRLELYNFALHIWKTHPIMGIGLRSFTQSQYLSDYQLRNPALHNFPQAVATIQAFDNMALTALVEMGAGMTLLYFSLVIGIVINYCRKLRSLSESSTLGWYRVLMMLGFAIHSLSYDSLLIPSVNWLFHVQLGIMAGYHVSEMGRSSIINPNVWVSSETLLWVARDCTYLGAIGKFFRGLHLEGPKPRDYPALDVSKDLQGQRQARASLRRP